ncbi:MliC family protein [Rouxiella silvae]|uniref:MliC family protein n=1 Tax=Rouxiella silvae TaxID=1646373 RepID=A0AA40X2Z0_9GAMM|nr:MliC family protein [Rouxiella silvae]MBF6637600.1 MliC family protein [Rouxiella silvae]
MDIKIKTALLALTGVALSGCSLMDHNKPAQSDNTVLHYSCGTTPLTVTLDKPAREVSLVLDGIQLHLPQVVAASGTRYSDGHYTFWSKGNAALVQRGDDVIINDCDLLNSGAK